MADFDFSQLAKGASGELDKDEIIETKMEAFADEARAASDLVERHIEYFSAISAAMKGIVNSLTSAALSKAHPEDVRAQNQKGRQGSSYWHLSPAGKATHDQLALVAKLGMIGGLVSVAFDMSQRGEDEPPRPLMSTNEMVLLIATMNKWITQAEITNKHRKDFNEHGFSISSDGITDPSEKHAVEEFVNLLFKCHNYGQYVAEAMAYKGAIPDRKNIPRELDRPEEFELLCEEIRSDVAGLFVLYSSIIPTPEKH